MAAADTRHAALSAVPGGVSGTANGKQALAAIVLSAVGLRAGVVVAAWLASGDPDVFHAPDTWSYVAPARELLETGAYTRFGEPEVVRAPGYPLLLVPGLLLGRLEAVTLALHLAIAALTVAGTFALALQVLGDRRAALAAAALHAVDPSSIAATSLLLTETAFTACVVWGAWFLARWAREGATRELLAGTALLALAAYFRPLGYFLPFGVAGFALLRALWTRRWRALPQAAGAGVAAVALVVPWQLRNAAEADYGGFSGVSAESLYFYDAGAILARREGLSLEEQQERMGWPGRERYFAAHPEQAGWTPGQRFRWMEAEAKRVIVGDPAGYAVTHLRGTAKLVLGTGGGELQHLFRAPVPPGYLRDRMARGETVSADLLHLPGAIYLAVVYLLVAAGLGRVHARRGAALLLLLGMCAYMVAVVGPAGGARFRHPVMPMVCLAAGAGWVAVRARVPSRPRLFPPIRAAMPGRA